MAKSFKRLVDEKLNARNNLFVKNISSDMHYQSQHTSDSMSFEWVDVIEKACPYIDNIVRHPKVALINEEDVVKIEKAKKISVDSVKDLSKHTQYIEKINEITEEIQPSKILITRREETFNTYENRFIYTLICNLSRFILNKEAFLEDFESKNNKVLEYAASTNNDIERINIEVKLSANSMPSGTGADDFAKEIENIKLRVKKIRDYITAWRRSEMYTSLEKDRVSFVVPPIRKTNLILKNPNFQVATKLWEFLQTYDEEDQNTSKGGLDTSGDDIVKAILDDAFLMNYFVLDSISSSKKAQKEKLVKYIMSSLNLHIKRAVALLLDNGIDISDQEILNMISVEINEEKNRRLVGSKDVRDKFKSALEEYLEKTQDYM